MTGGEIDAAVFLLFRLTSKMSHDYGWRDSCAAGGVTAMVVGSGALLGRFGLRWKCVILPSCFRTAAWRKNPERTCACLSAGEERTNRRTGMGKRYLASVGDNLNDP